MGERDPHIHVEQHLNSSAIARDLLASTFGLASDLPRTVTTGCGQRVPLAMTSARPESVTCLPCREHARQQHLRLADQVERLGGLPGMTISGTEAPQAAARLRDLADRFADPDR